jgi:hypothetical protein
VELDVYDLSGTLLSTRTIKQQPAGRHVLRRDWKSYRGIVIVKLQVAKYVQIKRGAVF